MTAQPPPLRAAADAAPAQPASLADLFWSFSWLALQGFGGVLAVVLRELVERKRWIIGSCCSTMSMSSDSTSPTGPGKVTAISRWFRPPSLQRARQTAEAVARAHGLAATHDARLRERHYGVLQGLTFNEAERQQPQAWQHFKRRDPQVALDGGGESLGGLAARVHGALEEIAARHAGETVVVVTHGGVLDIAHRLATGKTLEGLRDFAIPNAALNWIEHTAGSWRLIAWADERHLADALDELPGT